MTNEKLTTGLKHIAHTMERNGHSYYQHIAENAIKALEQGDVLEKIRSEILDEAEYAYADFDGYKEDILHTEPDELPDDDFRYGLERAVEIINKYKRSGAE